MAQPPVHYLAIGHVARDLTPEGPRLGGTAAYAALTAGALDYAPGIVTACDPGLDLEALAGVALTCAPAAASTVFENVYSPAGRRQFLRGQAPPLAAADIPPDWLRAPVIHVAPLAQELDPDIVLEVVRAAPGAFVGLTPQGWLRQWDAAGQVVTTPAAWRGTPAVLQAARAAVVSIHDFGGDWAIAEQWARAAPVLAVTEGASGCTVFARGQGTRQFRAPPVTEVDPTGAGDVFAAAFFINLYETDDPWASARFANQVAALSVTRAGLAGVPDRSEVGYCRTRAMLE
jgi:sugar/nucleoside kinase (ribokinase family)